MEALFYKNFPTLPSVTSVHMVDTTDERVTVTIDGRTVEVPKGTTVLQAAEQIGIFIPRYCYHPGLSIAGNCRICMVRVEKAPRLMTACSTYVQDGMVVHTTTDEVLTARRSVLEFLLLHHPVDCPVCDQAGECWLQDYYMDFGRFARTYFEPRIRRIKAKPIGPHVILDQERCILCTRCIRFCDEIARAPQLGLFNRGNRTVVDVFPGEQLDHPYSGNVVDVCPVGALLDRDFRFRARVWFLNRTRSICPGCSTGCNIFIDWNEDKPYLDHGRRVFRFKPRYNPEVNQYWMCDYGRYNYRWLDDGRIDAPYVWDPDRHIPTDWEAVLNRLTRVLDELRSTNAMDRVAVLLSPHLTTEELYVGRRLFRDLLGVRDLHYTMPTRDPFHDDFLIQAEKYPNARAAELLGIGADAREPRDILERAAAGTYRVVWIVGQNPVRAYGEAVIQQVYTNTELVILQTCNWTASTEYAHIVLPAAPFAEKNGTFINHAYRIQKLERAVRPYKMARPDWQIFLDAARRLGLDLPDYASEAEIFDDMARHVPVFQGLRYADIGPQGHALKPETAPAATPT